MGEVLRSSFAKRFAKKHFRKFRARILQAHQWGAGVPNARGSCPLERRRGGVGCRRGDPRVGRPAR
eukprot:6562590-Lingulodinium_polyedra.AAC.1